MKYKATDEYSENTRAHTFLREAKVLPQFIERVENATKKRCWIWIGSLKSDGYGQWRGNGAHRWLYQFLFGLLPPGTHLDHTCRIRACVNPFHLEPVTPRENYCRIRAEGPYEGDYESRFKWRGRWRTHKPQNKRGPRRVS